MLLIQKYANVIVVEGVKGLGLVALVAIAMATILRIMVPILPASLN